MDNRRISESCTLSSPDQELRRKYGGVPELYIEQWETSDEKHLNSSEWESLLIATDKAAQEASCICRYLEAKTGRMTFNRLQTEKKALLYALHKMEDLLEELDRSYPTEGTRCYAIAKNTPALTGRIPEFLLKSDDQVLIWMPRLPAKTKWASSIGYKELQDLLHEESATLPHFEQWHCDFFHVFNPVDTVGVKDVDNYAYKQVIDALARAFCTNDAYDNFSYAMFNFPSEVLKRGCYVHIYKQSQKVGFFQKFEELALPALTAQNRT